MLRNYEGVLFRYAPEDRQDASASYPSQGVSSLLGGERDVLIPDGTPRMARRENIADSVPAEMPDVIQISGFKADEAQQAILAAANWQPKSQ